MLDEETIKAMIHIAETGQCLDVENQYGQFAANISIKQLIAGEMKLRIKKPRPIIAREIWKVLPDWVTCIAWDDGTFYPFAYTEAVLGIDSWDSCKLNYITLMDFNGLSLNGCDWRDSKVERPE